MGITLRASIVLPTHGRRDSLLHVLRALADQRVPADEYEAVVVCDGDVDGTVAACQALASEVPYRLRVIEQPNQGPAAARNRAVAEAQAPLIVFLDDDVVPDPCWLAAHLDAQAGQEQCVTIGPLLPPVDLRLNAWGEWEERTLLRQYAAMSAGLFEPSYRQFYTGNASILKRHIVEAGGFNAAFRRAEDVELGIRLRDRGLHFTFLPEAKAWHYVVRTFAAWQRMPTAYGLADVELARSIWHPILVLVARDYAERHWVGRRLSALCAGRPPAIASAALALGVGARLAHAARRPRLSSACCGLIFNVRYYDGIARGLGGRRAFLRLVGGQASAEVAARLLEHAPQQVPMTAR